MKLEPKWRRKLKIPSRGTDVAGALDTMTLSHVLLLDGAMLMLMVLVVIVVAIEVNMCVNEAVITQDHFLPSMR